MRWPSLLSLVAVLLQLAARPAAAEAAEAVTVDGIAATFMAPAGATVAVLILPGSGPVDRDGNGALGLKTDAYRQLAEGLARAGVASLRYDKRGVGASRNNGDGKPVEEAQLTLETSAADATRLAAFLKARPGITRVAMVGHSEGGLVALVAAKSGAADRVVLVTTAGFPLGQVLRTQLSRQPIPDDTMNEFERVLGVLEKGGDPGEVKPPLGPMFRAGVRPFLRSVLAVDPVALVKATKQPVLVIGGGSDIQIGRFDFDALAGARPGVESLWVARLTHTLKPMADDDASQVKAYTDPALPVMPELVEKVVAFVKG